MMTCMNTYTISEDERRQKGEKGSERAKKSVLILVRGIEIPVALPPDTG